MLALSLGFVLAGLAFAPAPPEPARPPTLKEMAEERYKASLKAFEEAWVYYRQARTDPYFVYAWSLLAMDARAESSDLKGDYLAAHQDHLDRMQKLDELVKRVRKIGFARSLDIASADYFVKDAQYRLARAKAQK